MKRIKLILMLIFPLFSAGDVNAQLKIESLNGKNVAEYIEKYLIGPNITLVNDSNHRALFNKQEVVASNQFGFFTNGDTSIANCSMPIDTGLVIATMEPRAVQQGGYKKRDDEKWEAYPSFEAQDLVPEFYYLYNKYCIENERPTWYVHDVASLSFWIRTRVDDFAFSYSFASREYAGYVGTQFNDFMAIYFSGPYDEQGNYLQGYPNYYLQQLSLIPGTNTLVTVNTVNHGNAQGENISHPEYHIENCKMGTSKDKSQQLPGYTTRLQTAPVKAVKGALYKIEATIGNVYDHNLISLIFLTKDSRRFDTTTYIDTVCENEDWENVDKYFGHSAYYEEIDAQTDHDTVVITSCHYNNVTHQLSHRTYDTLINTYTMLIFRDTLKNATEGDSVIMLYRFVLPSPYQTHMVSLVNGDSINTGSMVLNREGLFIDSLTTYLGCDSIIIYNVRYGDTTCIDCYGSGDIPGVGLETAEHTKINIYPNPADNFITLEGLSKEASVTIIDINGREVLFKESVSNNTLLSLDNIPPGTYTVIIQQDKKTVKKKLIIK